MCTEEVTVADESTLEARLHEVSRAIGRAKRAGEDPSSLIAEHRVLKEELRQQEPRAKFPPGPCEPTLQVIQSPAELLALKPQYDALLKSSSATSAFMLLEWLLPWYDHFGRDYDLCVAVVRQGERLLAAAPLMVGEERRFGNQPVVRFLGTGPGLRGDYFAFALDSRAPEAGELLREHVKSLLGRRRLLHLEHLSPFADGLDTLALLTSEPDRELLIRGETGCVHGPLPRTFSEFVRHVPAPQRRTKLRCGDDEACRHHGDVAYDECTRPEQVDEFLALLKKLNSARQQHKGAESTWRKDINQRCRVEISRQMLERGALRLDSMCCGGKSVAALIGFVFKGRYFCYNIGFDQEFASYEPGHLLLARRIQGCIDEGLHTFDFLVGDTPYKRQYFRNVTPEMQVTVLPHRGGARLRETARLFARSVKRLG